MSIEDLKKIHKKHCEYFNNFIEKIDPTNQNIQEWIDRYNMITSQLEFLLDASSATEGCDKTHVQSLGITNTILEYDRLFKEIENIVVPMALAYWVQKHTNGDTKKEET